MAQLAVLRTWGDAILSEGLPSDQQDRALKRWEQERDKALTRYKKIACPTGPKASVDYWSALLSSTDTCN